MNPRSRHTARRLMFACRRAMLAAHRSAVENGATERDEGADPRLRAFAAQVAGEEVGHVYYLAREMAHHAHRAMR